MHSKDRFDELKSLIRESAFEIATIGDLAEAIKWGQLSFTPATANIGSSVRIEERNDGVFALMFICTTGLVEQFREIYPDTFQYEGNRAIVIPKGRLPSRDALKHCIQLALTYKLARKPRR
ncbi:MAG: DUF1801 domain-containing protein [Pseudomonadota bacterium]